jgi:N-sulfoglucosamine sulfohydrolase
MHMRSFFMGLTMLCVWGATEPGRTLALDANRNGISDVWEAFYPAAATDLAADFDGDGVSNAAEAYAGTNPTNAASRTRPEMWQATTTGAAFQWQSREWLRYRARSSTNLSDWSWQYTPLLGNGQSFNQVLPGGGRGFVQLQILPALNSDTDALDNLEEAMLGTDPQNWDTDGDKVSDDVEFLLGTNPLLNEDTDGDGLPDDWERWIIQHDPYDDINTLADVRPEDDFDGDGIPNGQEFLLGTSPVHPRRNILFFLTEDQSAHLGCLGTVGLSTPRLDSLGASGLIFSRAFAAAAVCSPAKMAIYTGTHPHHNAGFRNVGNYNGSFPLPPDAGGAALNDEGVHEDLPTLIEILSDRGWFTAVSHKLHVEPVRKYPYAKGYGQPSTPALAASIISDLVASAGPRPFFMTFNIGSPHLPFRSLPNANGQWSNAGGLTGDGQVLNVDASAVEVPNCYPDVPGVRQDIADYYGAIQVIDSIFGAVVDALAASGQLTNTLIVFTSDHGIGLHRGKQSAYGLGLHIPLLMSGPGMAGTRVISAPVSHTDLAPTFVDFAGLPPQPSMTGRSLLPIFQGQQDEFADRATVLAGTHHRYDARVVCDGRYYYIRNLRNVTGATLANPANALNADQYQNTAPHFNRTYNATVAATGTPQRKLLQDLVEGKLPPEELYDLDSDQYMTTNLVARPELQGQLGFLRAELERWRMFTEDYQTSSSQLVRRTQRLVSPSGGITVDAGGNQTIFSESAANPVAVVLNGFVSGGGATSWWSKVSGPGSVSFADPAALNTTATLTGLGSYLLRLEAGTGTNVASDTVTIEVTTNLVMTLANGSFETPHLEGSGSTTTISGWNVNLNVGFAVITPEAAAPDGEQIVRLRGMWSTAANNGGLTQLSSLTIEPGTYTLTFDGVSLGSQGTKVWAALYTTAATTANYLAGTNAPVGSEFSRHVLAWTVGEGDARLGQSLGVQLLAGNLLDPPAGDFTGEGSVNNWVGIDRVRLEFVPHD